MPIKPNHEKNDEEWILDLNPDFDDLDPEEQELRDSIDSGEWVSELTPERLQEIQEAARQTLEAIRQEKEK